MNNKKILITGATGFVGSYLTRYLVEKGYTNIIALKRATSRMDMVTEVADKVTWVEGDVLDMPFLEDALRGHEIEQIYHCALRKDPLPWWQIAHTSNNKPRVEHSRT